MESSVSRKEILTILSAAMTGKSYRFALEAAELWLKSYPGDIEVNLYKGLALGGLKRDQEEIDVLENLIKKDPENLAAHRELAENYQGKAPEKYLRSLAYIQALSGEFEKGVSLPEWSAYLSDIRIALNSNNMDISNSLITKIQNITPAIDLIGITQIRIASLENDWYSIYQIAEIYHDLFPECIHFTLWLAYSEMETNQENGDKAVSLLHQCVAQDAAGQIAEKLWGKNHRYLPLWPEKQEIDFQVAIPADVAAVLGLNRLPQGEPLTKKAPGIGEEKASSKRPEPEINKQKEPSFDPASTIAGFEPPIETLNNAVSKGESRTIRSADRDFVYENVTQSKRKQQAPKKSGLEPIEKAFENLAQKINPQDTAKLDARYPVYLIFSSRKALEKVYGPQQVGVIDLALKKLEKTIKEKANGWDALIYYPDDEACADKLGLPPVVSSDPWKYKLSITDLDNALSRQGKMVASILIVGGPEIVPFHRLPNPTDDMDAEVLSDNPYATHDSNYFVPEWPVGRVPGGAGGNSAFLLRQIQEIIQYHENATPAESFWSRFSFPFDLILQWFWDLSRFSSLRVKLGKTLNEGFGYTAAIWRRSSIAVYRPVSEAGTIDVCPPTDANNLDVNRVLNSNKSYFNLHGIENSGEWFGQKDSSDTTNAIDYPVALRPEDLQMNGHCPTIVFTEACYGAHVSGKNLDNALSLKFLHLGTKSFIGSTCIAYGSVTTPLIGADLLGYIFWKLVNEGYAIGDAYLKAKIEFVREMTKRQGYLDGEDQKTLISFILLGDPLATSSSMKSKSRQRISRMKTREQVKTICDNDMDQSNGRGISREVMNEVKMNLEKYLPGIEDANVSFSQQFVGYQELENGSSFQKKKVKNGKLEKTGNVVITVSKQVDVSSQKHHHYARVTLDRQGKMVKLAISR